MALPIKKTLIPTKGESLSQSARLLFKKHPQALGSLCALLTILCWSGNFIAGRGFANNISPFTLVWLRAIIALLSLLPFVWSSLRQDWKIVTENLRFFVIFSLLGLVIPNTCIYAAAYTSEAMNMAILSLSFPLFILLLTRVIYKEKLGAIRLVGISITLVGILVLISRGNLGALLSLKFKAGDFFVLANALSFAGYTLLLRKAPSTLKGTSFLFAFIAIGAVLLIPGVLWEFAQAKPFHISPMIIGGLLYVGIVVTSLAIISWNLAIKYAGTARASIIYYSLPLFSGIEGMLFFGEPMDMSHFISMGLVVSGLLIALQGGRNKA